MSPTEPGRRRRGDGGDIEPPIQCEACRSALGEPGRESVAFLLVEGSTVPVVGCAFHLEQFRSVCGFTTETTAELLEHRPAGGVPCPGCRLAPHNPSQPVISLGDGVVAVLACPQHRSDLIERFRTGLRTRSQLSSSLDTES